MATHLVLPMHGKQHCPGGPDPIPCLSFSTFRACNFTDELLVPDNNETDLTFDSWENNDENIFDVALTGGKLITILLLKEGVYSMNCRVTWKAGAGDIGEPTRTGIVMDDDHVNADQVTHGQANPALGPAGYVYSLMRTYPVFRNQDTTSTAPKATIQWSVIQVSPGAINQNTENGAETAMEIIYLGGAGTFTATYV